MNREKLFEAIGQVDERLLAGAEVQKKYRRLGWKVALVAAVVAGLTVTAVAAPAIRNALFGGKVETDDTMWITPTDPADGSSYEISSHEVTLAVDMDADAPKTIGTYYLPRVPEGMEQVAGHILGDPLGSVTQFWWIQDTVGDIHFVQKAGGSLQPEDLRESVSTSYGTIPEAELRTFAGIQGYLIDALPIGDGLVGDRIFFWSDGQYLFRLEVPYEYTDDQLEEMVASVQPVEDITPHLVTMSQEEMERVFG
ncbi:MAG: hypothetical protein IJW45_01790 [Oscillospiraceae bacterium]|nr:hypothetical protein [Oscillospiraceae bacterium]